jgi:hypothetical protein
MINISVGCSEKLEEYIMFDMQGQLEHSQETLNCVPLGQLNQINEKEYKLIIGIHDVIGTRIEIILAAHFISRDKIEFRSSSDDFKNYS